MAMNFYRRFGTMVKIASLFDDAPPPVYSKPQQLEKARVA